MVVVKLVFKMVLKMIFKKFEIMEAIYMKVKLHNLSFTFISALISLLFPLLLSGCSKNTCTRLVLEQKRGELISTGSPSSYIDGYIDGCSSGRRIAGDKDYQYIYDTGRANSDALYARGWQEGQINCRNEMLAEEQAQSQAPQEGEVVVERSSSIDAERERRVAAESKAAEAEMREIWEELRK